MKFISLLRTKDEYLKALTNFITMVGRAPNVIRIDNAGEMNSYDAWDFYEAHRIWVELCNAYEHHQSGRVESAIGSVSMRARVLLVMSGLPHPYWGFAARHAVFIENSFLPTRPDSQITCYETFHGKPPPVHMIKPFGCLAFLHVDVTRRQIKKLSETSIPCIHLGVAMDLGHKGYLLKHINKQRYFIASRSVTFDETRFPYQKPLHPDDAPWKEDEESPVIDWEPLEHLDNDAPIRIEEVEIVVDDEPDEDVPVYRAPTAERTSQILTRSMARARSEGGDINMNQPGSLKQQSIAAEPEPETFSPDSVEPEVSNVAPSVESEGMEPLRPSHSAYFTMLGEKTFKVNARQPSLIFMKSLFVRDAAAFIGLCMYIGVSMTLNPIAYAYHQAAATQVFYSATEEDPKSLDEALNRRDADRWWEATMEEWQSFVDRGVFEISDLPPGRRAIDSKIVYKLKKNELGLPERYKARIVARGFQQEIGVDYFESFSAMSHPVAIRLLVAMAAASGYHTNQVDIKTAFLYSDLEEEMYLTPPRGLEHTIPEGKVMKLKKAVYGLSQSGRLFWQLLIGTLKDFGFTSASDDNCIQVYRRETSVMIVATVVDDMLQISNDLDLIKEFNEFLSSRYIITDNGPLRWFLGVAYTRLPDGSYHASQTALVDRLCNEHGIKDEDLSSVPASKGLVMSDEDLSDNPDQVLMRTCRSILGVLTYLQLWTRPDISYSVNMQARYVTKASAKMYDNLKKVLKYLNQTRYYGVKFHAVDPTGRGHKLTMYVDASDADCPVTRRSTGGYVLVYNGSPIAWRSARQPLVTLSTCESELVQATLAGCEVMFVLHLLNDLGFGMDEPVVVFEDNKAAIDLSVNPCDRGKSKHIQRRWFWIREAGERGDMVMSKISGKLNPADAFTKAHAYDQFSMQRELLSVVPRIES